MEQISSWKIKKLHERSLKEHVDNREKEKNKLKMADQEKQDALIKLKEMFITDFCTQNRKTMEIKLSFSKGLLC